MSSGGSIPRCRSQSWRKSRRSMPGPTPPATPRTSLNGFVRACRSRRPRQNNNEAEEAGPMKSSQNKSVPWLLFLALGVLLLSACATPIGVARLSTQEAQQRLTANALSTGAPSSWSAQVLQRNGIFARFEKNPVETLAELHRALTLSIGEDRFQDG